MTGTTEDSTVPVADLGQSLGMLLRSYLENARMAVEDIPGGPRGFQVMSISATEACSNQATIASGLGLDRTVMTYLVDDLEKAGLVVRRPDPTDRRARQVVLTTKGRATLDAASARVRDVEREVLGPLSDDDAALFRELLGRVAAGSPQTLSAEACRGPDPCSPADL